MTSIGVLQIAMFFGLILVCTKPLGAFMARCLRASARSCIPFCGGSKYSLTS